MRVGVPSSRKHTFVVVGLESKLFMATVIACLDVLLWKPEGWVAG